MAQAIREEMEARNWQLQDFARELRDASEGRLRDAGANGLARRAIHGKNVTARNRQLLELVLGRVLPFGNDVAGFQAQLDALQRDLGARVARLESELAALKPPQEDD